MGLEVYRGVSDVLFKVSMRFCGADKKKRGTSWARSMEGDQCPLDTDALPAAYVRRRGWLSVVSSLSIFAKKVSGLKALKELKD